MGNAFTWPSIPMPGIYREIIMKRIYGYARVSTQDQSLDSQTTALQLNFCDKIYTDHGVSGLKENRPGLDKLLKALKPGDTLIVCRLERLGRSLQYLVSLVELLKKNDVHFVSLMECIDTSSPGGKLLFHLMAALAEFERSLTRERTLAGLDAARANGKRLGRRPALTSRQQQKALQALKEQVPLDKVAKIYGVHPRTIYRLRADSELRQAAEVATALTTEQEKESLACSM